MNKSTWTLLDFLFISVGWNKSIWTLFFIFLLLLIFIVLSSLCASWDFEHC